jgi:hypothetical protein
MEGQHKENTQDFPSRFMGGENQSARWGHSPVHAGSTMIRVSYRAILQVAQFPCEWIMLDMGMSEMWGFSCQDVQGGYLSQPAMITPKDFMVIISESAPFSQGMIIMPAVMIVRPY